MSDVVTKRPLNDPNSVMALSEIDTPSGHRIGVAVLNSEKTLNSLSLPMIEILAPQLERWEADPKIVLLWIQGAGERAFAAGGDIQDLYHAIKKNHAAKQWIDPYPDRFFAQEYSLDQHLLTFKKPILTWGHGFVMGGGMGIFTAGSHRVVTEKSRLAMPEVTIGLFPDAGGTWMLRGLERPLALWIGLTGVQLTAADALFLNLGQYGISQLQREAVIAALGNHVWSDEASNHQGQLHQVLQSFETRPDVGDSMIARHRERITAAVNGSDGTALGLFNAFAALAELDEWCSKAVTSMKKGCPTTIAIIVEQVRRAATLDLAQCFALELAVAKRCARGVEFMEGVRALLIDKDNQPKWRFAEVASVPQAHVQRHFDPNDESFP